MLEPVAWKAGMTGSEGAGDAVTRPPLPDEAHFGPFEPTEPHGRDPRPCRPACDGATPTPAILMFLLPSIVSGHATAANVGIAGGAHLTRP
ncbi:MAG: hypothetical protein JWQ81_5962 [Amycolatopsis sp.]|nr:hypothetical protein [Amycolatopsis sp.]